MSRNGPATSPRRSGTPSTPPTWSCTPGTGCRWTCSTGSRNAADDSSACYGNNDGPDLQARLPLVNRVELAGLRLAVVHETGSRQGRETRAAADYPGRRPAGLRPLAHPVGHHDDQPTRDAAPAQPGLADRSAADADRHLPDGAHHRRRTGRRRTAPPAAARVARVRPAASTGSSSACRRPGTAPSSRDADAVRERAAW